VPEPGPPIACTLPPDRMGDRLQELTTLLAGHVVAVRRRPRRLTLTLSDPQHPDRLEAAARDLFARERQCCPFFTFSFRRAAAELLVEVGVPAPAEPVLDGLQALAERAAQVAR
jgi:hypothetical protein